MDNKEDDDVMLLRASATLLADLERLVPKLLRRRKRGGSGITPRVRENDMFKIFALLEPFQEDPQLLDAHLKTLIPPLIAAYLETLHTSSTSKRKKGFVPLPHAICQILNLLCKVRGERVVKGFLNNEPRYLEPMLEEFESGKNYKKVDDEPLPQSIVPWAERYILLLWLSHLMLAPFPLASMSTVQSSKETSVALGIDLPAELPTITLRVLNICVGSLGSASKERGAAANLLVRLCIRPDMQKLGLLDAIVTWCLSSVNNISEDTTDIHQCLGLLSFITGLVTSATNDEIGPFLPSIYQLCQNISHQTWLSFIKSSAVARKLLIKSLRNTIIHCLQAIDGANGLDTATVLEETIEFLLDALADRDTPVRYAASKALSIVTMKLDSEMAGDVVEAILGSLNENVYWQGLKRNLGGVNHLRWHGLTLTLSHLLYRRAISTSQLPNVLNALLLALSFEQRSPTGGSIGTNVRDAACFGIWALSRRYTTDELLAVEISSVRDEEHRGAPTVLQLLAIELLVVACLDPAGNIRRGSSAALQELIGRQPNTVYDGIPLVQIVDFHAVGLRDRAMCEVSIKAAELHRMYWDALFNNLLGWRGTGSLDSSSRLAAARAIGLLGVKRNIGIIRDMAIKIKRVVSGLKPREVEERQGLVSALAAVVNQATGVLPPIESMHHETALIGDLIQLWQLFDKELNLDEQAFTSPGLRPELTASSICTLLGAMATMTYLEALLMERAKFPGVGRLLNLCLGRHEDSVLEAIPYTTRAVLRLFDLVSPTEKDEMVALWMDKLENRASYNGLRCSGFAIALGAAYSLLGERSPALPPTDIQSRILDLLIFRCTSGVAVEARTVALQALDVVLRSYEAESQAPLYITVRDRFADGLHTALNDYTITERGDVGSLVRLGALSTVGTAWETGLLKGAGVEEQLHADVLRLSLEKLDKVRLRAAHVLEKGSYEPFEKVAGGVLEGVSSYVYFANALNVLHSSVPVCIKEAVCLGLVSSAGMGSESVVQNSRAALLDAVDAWPTANLGNSYEHFSLLDFASCLLDLLKRHLDTERVLLPLLEVIAFLLDMSVLQKLPTTRFNFRALLSYTQKAHFKSTYMQKLHLVLDVYRGLGAIPTTRVDTIAKVASMLLHPFPKIRISAAETLWVLTQEDGLKRQDWSQPSKNLKPMVDGIKAALTAER